MSTVEHPQLYKFLDQAQHVAILIAHGILSLTWLWPLRGIYFSVTHPAVILSVRAALLKALFSSAIIFGALLFFTWVPQMAVLAVLSGPLAPVLAFILVGAESALVVAYLARPLLLDPALTQVFDATLRARGQGELVKTGKTRGKGVTANVEGALVKPFQALSKDGIVRYLITLPLNFVPVIGTVLFVLYNGYAGGPNWHARYFQLKGLSRNQRTTFIERRRAEYAAFGTVTLLCNFIPFVGLLFSFTNTVGAAMWAAQLEAQANIIDGPPRAEPTQVAEQMAQVNEKMETNADDAKVVE